MMDLYSFFALVVLEAGKLLKCHSVSDLKKTFKKSLSKPGSFKCLPAPSSLVRLPEHFCLRCGSLSSFLLHCRMQASLTLNWRLAARLPISFTTVKVLIFSATESCILLFFPSILIFKFTTQRNVSVHEKQSIFKRLMNEMWNFRPQGDGRSGPWGPLLPKNKLNVFNMLNIEKIACSDLSKLCYYYAPLKSHRKWLCYFVPYDHGKLVLSFVHGRAEKCIINSVHILGRNRRGK